MGYEQKLTIYLKNGMFFYCYTRLSYFSRAVIIESIENAGDNDIVTFENDNGDELLIPKKNILLVRIDRIEPDDDEKEDHKCQK